MTWFDWAKTHLTAWKAWANQQSIQALALARQEAVRMKNDFVGTEHVLLGLAGLNESFAAMTLSKSGLTLPAVRSAVEKRCPTGVRDMEAGRIPYTPRVKKILYLAGQNAKRLNHRRVGTEHLLLGLLEEGGGIAGEIFREAGISTEQLRKEILAELGTKQPPQDGRK